MDGGIKPSNAFKNQRPALKLVGKYAKRKRRVERKRDLRLCCILEVALIVGIFFLFLEFHYYVLGFLHRSRVVFFHMVVCGFLGQYGCNLAGINAYLRYVFAFLCSKNVPDRAGFFFSSFSQFCQILQVHTEQKLGFGLANEGFPSFQPGKSLLR